MSSCACEAQLDMRHETIQAEEETEEETEEGTMSSQNKEETRAEEYSRMVKKLMDIINNAISEITTLQQEKAELQQKLAQGEIMEETLTEQCSRTIATQKDNVVVATERITATIKTPPTDSVFHQRQVQLQEWENRLQQQFKALEDWNDALNNWQSELDQREALLDFKDEQETEEDDEHELALERRIPTSTRPTEEDSGLGNSPPLGRNRHTMQADNGQLTQVIPSARISGRD